MQIKCQIIVVLDIVQLHCLIKTRACPDFLFVCVCEDECRWMHYSWVSLNRNFRLYSSLLNLPSICHPLIHGSTSSPIPEKGKEREGEDKRKRARETERDLFVCQADSCCGNSVTSFSASWEEMSCHVACRPSITLHLNVHTHTYTFTHKRYIMLWAISFFFFLAICFYFALAD